MHIHSAATEAIDSSSLWEIATYRGLFSPARTHYVRANSKYEAECFVAERLSSNEWFPTFSARPVPADLPREHTLTAARS